MRTFIIWTDLSHSEQAIRKRDILLQANPGDRIVYQGPNQMDQTWYEVVEMDGIKELIWIHQED